MKVRKIFLPASAKKSRLTYLTQQQVWFFLSVTTDYPYVFLLYWAKCMIVKKKVKNMPISETFELQVKATEKFFTKENGSVG